MMSKMVIAVAISGYGLAGAVQPSVAIELKGGGPVNTNIKGPSRGDSTNQAVRSVVDRDKGAPDKKGSYLGSSEKMRNTKINGPFGTYSRGNGTDQADNQKGSVNGSDYTVAVAAGAVISGCSAASAGICKALQGAAGARTGPGVVDKGQQGPKPVIK
jgi:hypothetical protein